MNCARFATRLEALAEGTLSADDRRSVEAHLARCQPCRELFALRRSEPAAPHVQAPAGFTAAILERTSGSTCGQARQRLGEYVDGGLDGLDHAFVHDHVAHCSDCAATASAFAQLAEDLPAFVELEPPADLVASVLAATRPHVPWWRVFVAALPRVDRLLERPRIALEAGYVGAVVLWLVFGVSWSPLRAAPVEALAALSTVQPGPIARLAGIGDLAWDATGSRVLDSARAAQSDLGRRYTRISEQLPRLASDGGGFGANIVDQSVRRSASAMRWLSDRAERVLRQLTSTNTGEQPD